MKKLTALLPKITEDEVMKELAELIVAGKSPYGASQMVAEGKDLTAGGLYLKARKIAETIQSAENGGLDALIVKVRAGESIMVPELRVAKIRSELRKAKLEIVTEKYQKVTLDPDQPAKEPEPPKEPIKESTKEPEKPAKKPEEKLTKAQKAAATKAAKKAKAAAEKAAAAEATATDEGGLPADELAAARAEGDGITEPEPVEEITESEPIDLVTE